MKKISILILLMFPLFFRGISQNENIKDGFYQSYEDYLSGKVKYEGEIWHVLPNIFGSYSVLFKEKEKKKKHKVKNSPYWGCINYFEMDGKHLYPKNYRFYEGKAYQIILDGKITLYATGPIDVTRDKNGDVTDVSMTVGSGSGKKKLFLHKGNNDIPKRMTSQKMVGELLADDKEVYEKFNKNKSMSSGKIFMNVIESIQLYNSHNK